MRRYSAGRRISDILPTLYVFGDRLEYAPAGREALGGQVADGLAGVFCEVFDIGDRHQGMDGIDERYCVAVGELRDKEHEVVAF